MRERGVGRVAIVGAGPGDPGLLTLRGKACLEHADVILYDYLVNPVLLEYVPAHAERIDVGKRGHRPSAEQVWINELLIMHAQAGRSVVRLKGGDPFVFGRGGEEALALAEAGIPFEIVPGISAAIAVPAYAGIPLTHRGLASGFTVLTGHEEREKGRADIDWRRAAAAGAGTLVLMMSARNLGELAARLIEHGRPPETPIAIVRWGTYPFQETVTGTLATIGEQQARHPIAPPAVVVVGAVAGLRERLRWFDTSPLFGKRLLVAPVDPAGSDLLTRVESERAVPIVVGSAARVSAPGADGSDGAGEIDTAVARDAVRGVPLDAILISSAAQAAAVRQALPHRDDGLAATINATPVICSDEEVAAVATAAGLRVAVVVGSSEADAILRAVAARLAVAARRA